MPSSALDSCVLEMVGVNKRFGAVEALREANFQVRRGEVHALLGENGAGKTTLMNIAAGIIAADSGRILVEGKEITGSSPREAFSAGLGMVHQHFRLVRHFTVAENVHLGLEKEHVVTTKRLLEKRTRELSERFGIDVRPEARISDLTVGERQRVAILRALVRGARILILDEPTSVLTPQEALRLFTTVRVMTEEQRSVVLISHKLDEVMEVADRVTVLRGGSRVATASRDDCSTSKLAQWMVGHEIVKVSARGGTSTQDRVLALKDVDADDSGRSALRGVTLEVYGEEIVGVAGVSGNGQRSLAEIATGVRSPSRGKVEVGGRDLTNRSAQAFVSAGVGYIPEDVHTGLALRENVEISAIMRRVERPPIRRGPLLIRTEARSFARKLLDEAGLGKVRSMRLASTLSGGQAQRLIVRRELDAGRRVLVAVHPTRGLDVAAMTTVQQLLLDARSKGVGVLLISEDLDELIQLSDRLVVMYEGRVTGEFLRRDFNREQIGLAMGGSQRAQTSSTTVVEAGGVT